MTGFGRGSASAEGVSITVEVKTVNHKHLNIYINGSRSCPELESSLRTLLTHSFERGSVQASLNVERSGAQRSIVELDLELVRAYADALDRLQQQLGDAEPPSPKLPLLAALPGALVLREPQLEAPLLERLLTEAATRAVSAANELRSREGKTLGEELLSRLSTLARLITHIEPLHRQSISQFRTKLTERVAELLTGTTITLPQDRLELEVALLADKSDVCEEIERLRSHLQQFEGILAQDGSVGRRLDFLCQEISRECNPIGSKSQDARLSQIVIEMRSENERIREQVQNLE
jgi:uncharacterized protein (TIGR00255 family)